MANEGSYDWQDQALNAVECLPLPNPNSQIPSINLNHKAQFILIFIKKNILKDIKYRLEGARFMQ